MYAGPVGGGRTAGAVFRRGKHCRELLGPWNGETSTKRQARCTEGGDVCSCWVVSAATSIRLDPSTIID